MQLNKPQDNRAFRIVVPPSYSVVDMLAIISQANHWIGFSGFDKHLYKPGFDQLVEEGNLLFRQRNLMLDRLELGNPPLLFCKSWKENGNSR